LDSLEEADVEEQVAQETYKQEKRKSALTSKSNLDLSMYMPPEERFDNRQKRSSQQTSEFYKSNARRSTRILNEHSKFQSPSSSKNKRVHVEEKAIQSNQEKLHPSWVAKQASKAKFIATINITGQSQSKKIIFED